MVSWWAWYVSNLQKYGKIFFNVIFIKGSSLNLFSIVICNMKRKRFRKHFQFWSPSSIPKCTILFLNTKFFMSNLTHLAMQDQNDIAFTARVLPLSLKSTFKKNNILWNWINQQSGVSKTITHLLIFNKFKREISCKNNEALN